MGENRKNMRRILFKTIVIGAALSATVAQASLDIAAYPGSTIEFLGGGTALTGAQFQITDSIQPDASLGGTGFAQWDITSPIGPALGLLGRFNGGPWSYGAITVSGVDQSANVTTPAGSFTIDDGSGYLATGSINWVQVTTHSYTGGVNAAATVNISGMTYTGPNTDLLALVAGGNGSVNLSFQFSPGETLTDLTTGSGPYATSYSGSLSAVPEPPTMIAGALLLLPFGASTLRILRRRQTA
jgi:hypothetical protein